MTADHLDREEHHETADDNTQAPAASVNPVAPQDTQAAGASGKTQIEQLQDNVSGTEQKGAHEQAQEFKNDTPGGNAGYHSTGSWSGVVDK